MDIKELIDLIKNCGVAGAGGAGFPSYAKIDQRAEVIILNGAECEPLLKVHRQLLHKYAYEIMSALDFVAKLVGAKEVIIALKSIYTETIEAVESNLEFFPNTSLKLLQEIYPTGDELVLIYDTLKKVVPPGSFPIDIGVAVFNVETMYNIYKAINFGEGVHTKYLSIVGQVKEAITVEVPIGSTVEEVVKLSGGSTINDPVYIMGGPMTGNIVNSYDTITKTSNAILVLSKEHPIIQQRESSISSDLKRATSVCCQCEMCTDLCPRYLLGHPISPHMFMRYASSGITSDQRPFINTMYCSSCGICEMYACPQGLSPRKLISKYKEGLKENGITPLKLAWNKGVDDNREYRKVPMDRLITRLGLVKYDLDAILVDSIPKINQVRINLNQNIGKASIPIVKKGDLVELGQMIGKAADNCLSIPIHSSISGKVLEVNDKYIVIKDN